MPWRELPGLSPSRGGPCLPFHRLGLTLFFTGQRKFLGPLWAQGKLCLGRFHVSRALLQSLDREPFRLTGSVLSFRWTSHGGAWKKGGRRPVTIRVGLPNLLGPPGLKEADPCCLLVLCLVLLLKEKTDKSFVSIKAALNESVKGDGTLQFLLRWSRVSSGPAACLQTLKAEASLVHLGVGDCTAMCLSAEGAAWEGPRPPLSLAAACRLAATSWMGTSSLRGARAEAPQIPHGAGSGCLKPQD